MEGAADGRGKVGEVTGDTEPKPRQASAWKTAEAYGFDMSLIEANLRRTPAERIRVHARALELAMALRQALKTHRAGP